MKYVYILRRISDPSEFYTGVADNVEERVIQHNQGSSFHTAKFRPWELVSYVAFVDAQKAFQFEQYLKSGSGRAFANKRLR